MDEPTAALGPEETQKVGALISELSRQGIGILLVSHDINDVFDLASRLAVMKNGRLVGTVRTADVTKDEVLAMIIAGKLPQRSTRLTVDAHVHLWRLSRGDNTALSPAMTAIYRDREPADLKPLIDAAGVARVVVVQAAETLAETLFTVGLARKHAWIAGVVAWIELASPSVEEEVAALATIPAVKGVRPVRDDNRSIAWMLDSRLERGFQALQDHAFRSISWSRTGAKSPSRRCSRNAGRDSRSCSITAANPTSQAAVSTRGRVISKTSRRLPHVVCKLSGLLNCAGPGADPADVEVYINHVLKAFGPSRVMWASDWPPLDLASDYATWKRISDMTLQSLPKSQQIDVMEGTAARVYRLDS